MIPRLRRPLPRTLGRTLGFFLLLALALVLGASRPSAAAAQAVAPELDELAFFLGEWELTTRDLRPDGSRVEGRATSRARATLDGHAIVDEFRSLGPDGAVTFRGMSVRTAAPDGDGYLVRWIMVGYPGYTHLRMRRVGDRLLGQGEGEDPMGAFLERFEYVIEGPDRYRFSLDRSYDGGESWIEDFGTIEARRVGSR